MNSQCGCGHSTESSFSVQSGNRTLDMFKIKHPQQISSGGKSLAEEDIIRLDLPLDSTLQYGPLLRYMKNSALIESNHFLMLSPCLSLLPSQNGYHIQSFRNRGLKLTRRQGTSKVIDLRNRISGQHSYAWKLKQDRETTIVGRQFVVRLGKGHTELSEEQERDVGVADEKKGTIAGAVALIIGTSIGSGMLALPQKASPAGVLPSSICMIICWGFLLIEALLLVEINVALRKKQKTKEDDELEIVSIRTMAQETLGDWGGNFATITYVFLGYTSMIAYSSKSGEILFRLFNLPEPVSACLFTFIFTMLISVGGTNATDQVNQWLTTSMIGLLLGIEVLAVVFGGWSGLDGSGNWEKVPATIPVLIFSLVYHDLAPVLCGYLGGDLQRLRVSVFLGSLVPLVALLVWDAIALGLSAQAGQVADPVDLLMSVKWSGVSFLVEAFSLLAVGTSLIGTLLGFSEFFKEQLKNFSQQPKNLLDLQLVQDTNKMIGWWSWWGKNEIGMVAMAIVIIPTLLVSTTVPDAFSAATEIAGGYCMTLLYGVLPPAMAWAMHGKEHKETGRKALSGARPALLGVGVFACGIVVEQIVQDFSAALHP